MRQTHWENIYQTKDHKSVSWYQEVPSISLELLDKVEASPEQSFIDIGCGASVLVDHLLERGFDNVTLIDLSSAALDIVKQRLGDKSQIPTYISQDITDDSWVQSYDIWHDRAVFHFLTQQQDRQCYMHNLLKGLTPQGRAIIGTFSLEGPNMCSGLDIVQYDADKMQQELMGDLVLDSTETHTHIMPNGSKQEFMYFIIKRQ
ncbi:class I SAM-dependent methyltransferase [Candidatus Albibeggiatoa sp. nov. NOAA]|uniref:class I SAM-dependent methyltransferase n=1 Tax=Candidatus Albibeggiatoa sp. nov. NOAA TaxID=3162724 RepID=UPI0033015FAE|nr:class I SAM-dependent methyltransferase [Thiotrichaceae bacterium]